MARNPGSLTIPTRNPQDILREYLYPAEFNPTSNPAKYSELLLHKENFATHVDAATVLTKFSNLVCVLLLRFLPLFHSPVLFWVLCPSERNNHGTQHRLPRQDEMEHFVEDVRLIHSSDAVLNKLLVKPCALKSR